jgi:hypothetical protein
LLTVLAVLSQGSTGHPHSAALVGAGHLLEWAGILVPLAMGQGACHQAASLCVLALWVQETSM